MSFVVLCCLNRDEEIHVWLIFWTQNLPRVKPHCADRQFAVAFKCCCSRSVMQFPSMCEMPTCLGNFALLKGNSVYWIEWHKVFLTIWDNSIANYVPGWLQKSHIIRCSLKSHKQRNLSHPERGVTPVAPINMSCLSHFLLNVFLTCSSLNFVPNHPSEGEWCHKSET